ncbi:Bacillolysin [bioreactor metagenome]|uniref:Bacillolysin n=1 Tax=bioreactor metagenome TaxID=1076179 RepID=A0A644ZFR8_9ZZZZ
MQINYLLPTPGNWSIFINAYTGEIVNKYNKFANVAAIGSGKGVLGDTKTLNLDKVTTTKGTSYRLNDLTRGAVISTYTSNYGTRTPGTLISSTTTTINDPAAVDAHYYAGVVYDYYKAKFNRNSINGAGLAIKSSVHYSRNYVNAGWTGTQMIYGDGDGVNSVALSGGLDVIAHEITHGVDQYEADLVYQNQSGALNESMSDAFGVFVEYYAQNSKFDWLMGEDIWTPKVANDALRDISDPTKYGDPAHMNNYVNTTQDNGGVHTNSGIPNKACYLITSNIGVEKAEQIYYRALTQYMTASTNFSAARACLAQAATDLYGAGSAEVTAVHNAFSSVGVN